MRRLLLSCSLALLPLLGQAAPALVAVGERATHIHVDKSERRMTLHRGEAVIGTYAIRLGDAPKGHKQREGDERTPEGAYTISGRNPNSRFHLSLRVSYPDASDRRRAREGGYPPGGDIMIHGGNAWFRAFDWTDGCIAVTDEEMDFIYAHVANGTPIRIDP
jgi:murein L,D-transpeptidase YafK